MTTNGVITHEFDRCKHAIGQFPQHNETSTQLKKSDKFDVGEILLPGQVKGRKRTFSLESMGLVLLSSQSGSCVRRRKGLDRRQHFYPLPSPIVKIAFLLLCPFSLKKQNYTLFFAGMYIHLHLLLVFLQNEYLDQN